MREIYIFLSVFWTWPTVFLAGRYFLPGFISNRYHQTAKPKKYFLLNMDTGSRRGRPIFFFNFGHFWQFVHDFSPHIPLKYAGSLHFHSISINQHIWSMLMICTNFKVRKKSLNRQFLPPPLQTMTNNQAELLEILKL